MTKMDPKRAAEPWVEHVARCERCSLAAGLGAARSDLSWLCPLGQVAAANALRALWRGARR